MSAYGPAPVRGGVVRRALAAVRAYLSPRGDYHAPPHVVRAVESDAYTRQAIAQRRAVRSRHDLAHNRQSARRRYAALKSVEGIWGTPEGF